MLVATDLDGTLVPDGSTDVGRYTAEVLRRVDLAGIPVVFVTARPLRWMEPFWPHVGGHGLAVVSNGAVTYDARKREVISVAGIDRSLGLEIVASVAAAAPGSGFAIECLDGIRLDPEYIEPYPVPEGSPRGPLRAIWDVPALKILVRNPALAHDELAELVAGAVRGGATATWSSHGLMEISALGVTKASALSVLCSRLGVPPGDVVAFGDMPNDIPMLAWAGTSYGVADAHETVLAMVDRVAPACQEEGVAQVLDSLLVAG